MGKSPYLEVSLVEKLELAYSENIGCLLVASDHQQASNSPSPPPPLFTSPRDVFSYIPPAIRSLLCSAVLSPHEITDISTDKSTNPKKRFKEEEEEIKLAV